MPKLILACVFFFVRMNAFPDERDCTGYPIIRELALQLVQMQAVCQQKKLSVLFYSDNTWQTKYN